MRLRRSHLRDPAKPRFDRSLTRPVPQLVGARRLRTLILSDVDYLKGADARSPTAATPDATARHRPLRLPVMGLPPRYTVANRPLRPTFSNLDSALCTHVPPNMPPAFPPSHLAPRNRFGTRYRYRCKHDPIQGAGVHESDASALLVRGARCEGDMPAA